MMKKNVNFTIKKILTAVIVLCIHLTSTLTVYAQDPALLDIDIPPKGSTFNESIWMVDTVTGRPTLRLTQHRDYNRRPTYHLNAPLVIYGAHNSGPHTLGQHSHPHCHMSPDAKKVTYNKGIENHSDVYVLFLE